jgi:hypothetical protein
MQALKEAEDLLAIFLVKANAVIRNRYMAMDFSRHGGMMSGHRSIDCFT